MHPIQKHLKYLGVETPMGRDKSRNLLPAAFETILQVLGLDLTDDSLEKTPLRMARMFMELTKGMDYANFPEIMTIENKMNYDEMVSVKDIKVHSLCEHHMLPIDGIAKVAYIPKDKIIGLSKIARIVDFFSRRSQVQERLTEQIFYALDYYLETDNIAVRIDAVHYCMKFRGIQDPNSFTVTQKLGGKFKTDAAVRNEFLNI